MKKLLWLIFAVVVSGPTGAWAATGSGAVDTWYVRPTGACTFNGDGLAYGCAASDGASGAFSTFANVIFTATTGVDNGDTLYVCGDHFTELALSSGMSGAIGLPITIRGDCPSDPGSIDTSALGATNDAIELTAVSYITVKNFGTHDGYGNYSHIGIRGAQRNGIIAFSSATPRLGIIIEDNVIDTRTASHATNACHNIYITGSGGATYTNSYIRRNVMLGTSTSCAGQDNNDTINVEAATGTFVIEDNFMSGGHEGLDISSGSGSGTIIRRNVAYNNNTTGIKIHGSGNCPVGMQVYGNVLYWNGTWALIVQDVQNSFILHNTAWQDGGSDPREAMGWGDVNGCTFSGNVVANNIFAASYTNGVVNVNNETRAEFEAAHTFTGNIYWQLGAETAIFYIDEDTGNNVTEANFATWQASNPYELNALPGIISSTGLTENGTTVDATLAAARLQLRSAAGGNLRRAGAPGYICQDARGRACYPDRPDIGAYQATSGDPANARTPR